MREFVLARFERRGIVVAEHVARMPAMPAVVAKLYGRQPCGFDAAIGQHFAFIPTKAEEGCFEAIIAWIEDREIQEVRIKRLVLMPEHAGAAAGLERADPLVGSLVNVPLLA